MHSRNACVGISCILSCQRTKITALQTRCPHCKTLFEIQEKQLRAASGQARCSCCNNIFNARKHLTQTDSVDKPVKDVCLTQKSDGAISLNGLFEESEPKEGTFSDFATDRLPAGNKKEPADEKQTNPESKKTTSHSEKINPDSESIDLQEEPSFTSIPEKQVSGPVIPEPAPFEPVVDQLQPTLQRQVVDPDGLTSQRPDPESIFQAGSTNKTKQGGHPFFWSIAILCLLVTALAQIVWFARGNLKHYPEVRELLELVCTSVACELPPWHEPERFVINSRSVRTHPKNSNALQIQLVFNNSARFPQPYPQLQLRLYDTDEKLSAQRVFRPDEYLVDPEHKMSLIKPAQSVEVDMALADPGAGVTGFKIEFL